MKYLTYTNNGPRATNEDSLFVGTINHFICSAIADGVGGVKFGEVASKLAIDAFEEECKKSLDFGFSQFVNSLNESLKVKAKELQVNMIATTFSCGIISYKKIKGIHVGDSRICLLRNQGIKQLTEEHNEAGRLLREGKITAEAASVYPRKNVLESALGSERPLLFQTFEHELQTGDRLVFSTDGFHEIISKKEIRDLSVSLKSLSEFHRRLKIEVENRIMRDNTTFICIEI